MGNSQFRQIHKIDPHTSKVSCVEMSQDEKYLATGGADNYLCIFDGKTFEQSHKLISHHQPILDLSFSHDSQHICTTSEDKSLQILSCNDFIPVQKIPLSDVAEFVFYTQTCLIYVQKNQLKLLTLKDYKSMSNDNLEVYNQTQKNIKKIKLYENELCILHSQGLDILDSQTFETKKTIVQEGATDFHWIGLQLYYVKDDQVFRNETSMGEGSVIAGFKHVVMLGREKKEYSIEILNNGPLMGWNESVSVMSFQQEGKYFFVGGNDGGLGIWWIKEEEQD